VKNLKLLNHEVYLFNGKLAETARAALSNATQNWIYRVYQIVEK
jgi:hypothetical protein